MLGGQGRTTFDRLERAYLRSGLKAIRVVHAAVLRFGLFGVRLLARVNGTRLHPRLSWNTALRMLMGWYEPATVSVCRSILRPGMVAVDVGANIGYYTRIFSELVGFDGKVYAFEPDPECHSLLRDNVRGFRYQNVVLLEKAISDLVGRREFFETNEPGTHSLFNLKLSLVRRRLEVESTTLDAFLEGVGRPSVKLIKIDVEGAEAAVLAGMEETLARSKGLCVVLELCPEYLKRMGAEPRDFLGYLRGIFDQCHIISPSGNLLSAEMRGAEMCMSETREKHVNLLCVR